MTLWGRNEKWGYGGLKTMIPMGSYIPMLSHWELALFERIRRRGFVGGSVGVGSGL